MAAARDQAADDPTPLSHKSSDDRDDGNAYSTDIEDPYALEGKTLFEKKCTLVNRAIDSMGMGRYQWCVWSLCGFGYLIDLLWAQAFGLVLGPLGQELNLAGSESGNISTSFSAGLTAGAAFWGILVDIIGRRWAFNLTCLCSSAFGLGLAGSGTYPTFLVLTAFVGFGVGGNIPIDTTITLEFIPQRHRRLLPFLSVFQPIGVVLCTAIAYGFIPKYSCASDLAPCPMVHNGSPCCTKEQNWGWRYTLLTVGVITMIVFVARFFVFTFHESPKFLIYRGRDQEAVTVLEKVSKFNRQQCFLTLEMLQSLSMDDESLGSDTPMIGGGKAQLQATVWEKFKLEMDRYKTLFSSFAMTRLTVLVWLAYSCDFWGFTLAATYTPIILSKKDANLGLSLQDTYRSYVYIYLPGIVGVALGVLGYNLPLIGRKWTMVFSSALMATSLFLFATVNNQASNIGLNVMEYFFQSMFNAVLYGWTPEAFPSYIRGTASGLASFFGRLFSIIAPLVAQSLLPSGVPQDEIPWQSYVPLLYLGGGVAFGAPLFISLLPNGMVSLSESM